MPPRLGISALRRVPANALRTQPWANGAGTITVIASKPDESNWQWRLSIADISQDDAFSPYPGTRMHPARERPITAARHALYRYSACTRAGTTVRATSAKANNRAVRIQPIVNTMS
ncbi:hypothetical protein EO087_06175 [Dyella sp. M7H15-1]|nr:hypothetical protein EO087_06175 [Dyella sp. M7H15-1]